MKELPRPDILREWGTEGTENFWEPEARPQRPQVLKALMQRPLIEALEQLRRRDLASDAPSISRNGYDRRSLIPHLGRIPDIRVPRLRHGCFQTQGFRRYRRCERLVEALIREVSLAGVSTRRVGAASVPCGRRRSPPAPSRG